MKAYLLAGIVTIVWTSTSVAQGPPQLPAAGKEHAWLKQYAGTWDQDAEIFMTPGQPPLKAKGTETNRLVGDFWMMSESKSEVMGMSIQAVMTIGYDPEKKKYIGTWIDSMSSHLWKYEGELDATGKVLTLMSDGPSPSNPTKQCKFKEVHQFQSAEQRTFSSSMLGDDGKWVEIVKVTMKRKK